MAQIDAIHRIFDKLGKSRQGKIKNDDLTRNLAIAGCDLSGEHQIALQKDCDERDDGTITFEEFNSALAKYETRLEEGDVDIPQSRRSMTPSVFRSSRSRSKSKSKSRGSRSPSMLKSPERALESAWDKILGFLKSSTEASKAVVGLFTDLDKDGSGGVDIDELSSGFADLGVDLTISEAKAFHMACDKNGDGQMTLTEFTGAVKAAKAKGGA